jgi:hypothetical protein
VIDYGIVNEEAWERVEELRIGERVGSSDVEMTVRSEEEGKNREAKGWGIGIKLFIFLELLFYVQRKCNQQSESPQGKIKPSFILKGMSFLQMKCGQVRWKTIL